MTAPRALILLLVLAPLASAATFTVTGSGDAGAGTLRQAILDANANPGADQIVFTVHFVNPLPSLPAITGPVAIDGTVGRDRANINGALSDCNTAFRFATGSSGSTLTNVIIRDFCRPVQVDAGVTNVTVTRVDATNEVQIHGDDNTFGSTTSGSGNRFFTVRILGDRNTLLRNNISFLHLLFAADNRIGSVGNGNTIGTVVLQSSGATIVEGNTFPGTVAATGTAITVSNADPAAHGATIAENSIRRYATGIGISGAGPEPSTGITISENSIEQVGIPIDLNADGSTPNDPAPDADTGANNLQNFPVLTAAYLTPSQLAVEGTLVSAPLTTYTIEIFSNAAADPDARTFLTSFDVTTDAAGQATFSRSIASPLPIAGEVLTATATNDLTGDTSEVSAAIAISEPGQLGFTVTAYTVNETDGSVTVTVRRSGGSEGTVTVDYATNPGSATAPGDYQTTSGTLTFGPGVTTQSIVVPIVNDAFPEPAESFTVTLTDPTGGATLGAATTTVTITAQAVAEAIPTLSQWSLIALALGLAMAMFVRLR